MIAITAGVLFPLEIPGQLDLFDLLTEHPDTPATPDPAPVDLWVDGLFAPVGALF